MSAVASAKPTKTTETTPHGSSRRCSPITKPAFSPRREHVFPRNHASRGRRTRPRRIQNPRSRLGESTIFPESTPRGLPGALCGVGGRFRVHVVPSVVALRCPFVPSVVISGCPVCRRWSLPGAICAIGGRSRAPVVASLVASGRPLCRWWSLLDALCAVGAHFRAPYWRHNRTKATCDCVQM